MLNRYAALLYFFLFIVPLTINAQSFTLDELKKQTQQDSYFDSASVFSSGQKAIELARKRKDLSSEAEILIYYGNYYYYNQQFDRSKKEFTNALAMAKKAKDKHLEQLARIRMNYIASENGTMKEANNVFYALIKECGEVKDHTNTIEAINGLAISMEIQNKPNEATKLYIKGLRIAEQNQLNYYIAVIKNNLGLVKLNNGQIDESLIDFKEALATAKKENNLRLEFHALNNVGLALSEQNKNAEAIKEYRTVLAYAHKINHPRELATAYINIGFSLALVKKADEGIAYYDSALTVLRENNMRYELTKGLLGKADILIKFNSFTEAEKNILEARKLSKENKDLQIEAYSHMLMHRLRKAEKKFEPALIEFVRYKDLLDSLDIIKNKKQIRELQIQYEVEKKDNALKEEKTKSLILEKENELKKARIRIIIFIAIFLLLATGIFFYIRYIRNIKKEQQKFSQLLIQNTEEERSRISRDLHDDIGQSLSVIKSKLGMELVNGKQEMLELEKEVGKIIDQTREISRSLYPSYLEKIGLTRSVARLMEKVQSSSTFECSFDIHPEVEKLSIETRTHLYRIIQECVNNTLKHSGGSALKVTIEKRHANFMLTYLDNGAGIANAQDTKGIGFMSMNERSRMFGGDMSIDNNTAKGFKLMIKFNGPET